jgi:hypothetical protein
MHMHALGVNELLAITAGACTRTKHAWALHRYSNFERNTHGLAVCALKRRFQGGPIIRRATSRLLHCMHGR